MDNLDYLDEAKQDAIAAEQDVTQKTEQIAGSSTRLQEYGAEMEALTAEVDSLEETLKAKKARLRQLKVELIIDEMRRLGFVTADNKGGFTLMSGGRVTLRTELYANVNKPDEQKLFDWLRSTGDGAMIKEAVHHSTLRGHVRELLEEGRHVPDFITRYHETSVSYTRPKGTKR